MEMPFGKYKGEDVEDLPESYLRWLTSIDLYGSLREAVYEALGKPDPQKQLPAQIQLVYKQIAKRWHPDTGGSDEAMTAVNEFYEELQKQTKVLA